MDFKNKIILAPMAGVTDYSFRKIAREQGADLCVTEMVSAKAIFYEDKKTATLIYTEQDDTPFSIQIFGHEPEIMKNAAYLLSRGLYNPEKIDTPSGILTPLPVAIDINMGCPVKKIVNSGDGSALMKNPKLCSEIISACVEGSSLPVTVKIRAGWDDKTINCVEIAKIAEASGASAICVHGRTREQMYEPYANWDYIKMVKDSVKIPVIANGDIFSGKDAKRILDHTGADSLMVGRGALGNPFIFGEIKAIFNKETYTPPTIFEKIEIAMKQVRSMVEKKGEYVAISESRKHLSWYLKGEKGCASIRNQINQANTLEEINHIINEYLKTI